MKTNLLRAELAYNGKTAKQLAETLGMSKTTLSCKINGKTSFTADEIAAICKYLDIKSPERIVDIFLS